MLYLPNQNGNSLREGKYVYLSWSNDIVQTPVVPCSYIPRLHHCVHAGPASRPQHLISSPKGFLWQLVPTLLGSPVPVHMAGQKCQKTNTHHPEAALNQ